MMTDVNSEKVIPGEKAVRSKNECSIVGNQFSIVILACYQSFLIFDIFTSVAKSMLTF